MATAKKTTARKRHVRVRRGYRSTTPYSIHHVLDMIPDGELPKLRAKLRSIVNDDLLWELLAEAESLNESRGKMAEAITKKLKKIGV